MQLALAMAVSSVDVCQWALVRAVFTKMVDKDEVGKVTHVHSFPAIKTFSKKIYEFQTGFLLRRHPGVLPHPLCRPGHEEAVQRNAGGYRQSFEKKEKIP